MDFSKFNKAIDMDQLNKDMAAAKENSGSGSYKEVPADEYTVQLSKLEVGETGPNSQNPGAPLLKGDFKIIAGEFKNSHLFINKVLYTERQDDKWNMGRLMNSVNGWLESLEPSEDIKVEFTGDYDDYCDLIYDIAEDIAELTYIVNYDPEAFNSISIIDVME